MLSLASGCSYRLGCEQLVYGKDKRIPGIEGNPGLINDGDSTPRARRINR